MTRNTFLLAIFALLAACSGEKKSNWDDIDYSSVYRRAGQRENDPGYTPSVIGCVDEDLYNCH